MAWLAVSWYMGYGWVRDTALYTGIDALGVDLLMPSPRRVESFSLYILVV